MSKHQQHKVWPKCPLTHILEGGLPSRGEGLPRANRKEGRQEPIGERQQEHIGERRREPIGRHPPLHERKVCLK